MNIKEAKEEIKNTVRAYTRRDESGHYLMSALRQRPILLIGPPGIGKTAIMQQIADECGIGLVSYTITHHTRQSAIGLPIVVKKEYDGQEYTVTEYTMSEIIASVYDCIKRTSCREGILFIDEINCVSETLAPTMLQLLQNKTFGTHAVPGGWVIVAAGNPLEYNKSAREFDIVTLDRVKKIDVREDLDAWREYAYKNSLHPCILSYLSLNQDHFYYIDNTAAQKQFVTARGWEDLSEILYQYEEMGIAVNDSLIVQYLQAPLIAREFAGYYQLYRKYRQDYGIIDILNNTMDETEYDQHVATVQKAPLDERVTVANLLLNGWNTFFSAWEEESTFTDRLHQTLTQLIAAIDTRAEVPASDHAKAAAQGYAAAENFISQYRHALQVKRENGLISQKEDDLAQRILQSMEDIVLEMKKCRAADPESAKNVIRQQFRIQADFTETLTHKTQQALEHGFCFAELAFAQSSEMALLVSDLTLNPAAMKFIQQNGCEKYFEHSKILLFHQKQQDLLREIETISDII